jgi:hypothetical protein
MLIDDLELEHQATEFVKAGRLSAGDLFQFFQEHAIHPDYYVDFTERVARNVINLSESYFRELDANKQVHFLIAVSKLLDFALAMKIWEAELGSNETVARWKDIPLFFVMVFQAIESLQSMRREIAYLEPLYTNKVICLEGETESMFIRTLQLSSRATWLDFSTYTYRGKGEIMHLVHLLKDNKNKGARIYLVYDTDGKANAFLKRLTQECELDAIFGFKRDFEGSFPPDILCSAIQEYALKYTRKSLMISPEEVETWLTQNAGFLYVTGKKLNIEFNKPKFGIILADLIARQIEEFWGPIMNNEPSGVFQRYEIHDFLKFLVH